MRYIQIYENYNNDVVNCYHYSNKRDHLINNDFKLEFTSEESIFGQAIYFTSQPIPPEFGKYYAKYEIILNNPLNLNSVINEKEADDLLIKFNEVNNLSIQIDFSDYDQIQYGAFFEALDSIKSIPIYRQYYKDFIQKLGYNSFYHHSNFFTDFEYNPTKFGYCYGIYDPKNIKRVSEIYTS